MCLPARVQIAANKGESLCVCSCAGRRPAGRQSPGLLDKVVEWGAFPAPALPGTRAGVGMAGLWAAPGQSKDGGQETADQGSAAGRPASTFRGPLGGRGAGAAQPLHHPGPKTRLSTAPDARLPASASSARPKAPRPGAQAPGEERAQPATESRAHSPRFREGPASARGRGLGGGRGLGSPARRPAEHAGTGRCHGDGSAVPRPARRGHARGAGPDRQDAGREGDRESGRRDQDGGRRGREGQETREFALSLPRLEVGRGEEMARRR